MAPGAVPLLFVVFSVPHAPAVRASITQAPTTVGLSACTIEGWITDNTGRPIAAAQVVLTGAVTRVERNATSHVAGWFTFHGLRPGRYWVTVNAPGYRPATRAVRLDGPTEMLRIVLPGPPNDPGLRWERFEAYEAGLRELESRHPERAAEYLEQAVRETPDFAPAYTNLGVAYLQLRMRHKARRAFEAAHDRDTESAGAHLGLGLIANDERLFSEAEEQLLEARRLDDSDWRVHYELGRAYYGLDRFGEAEFSLHIAAKEGPAYGNLYLLLANTLVMQEKYAEGLTAMERFLEVAPDSKAASSVKEKIHLLRAEIARR